VLLYTGVSPIYKGVRNEEVQKQDNFANMKFATCLVLLSCLAATAFAADLEVKVSRSDIN
jgi:hypothetical protein